MNTPEVAFDYAAASCLTASAYLDVFGWDACAAEVAALASAAASIVVVLLYAAAVGTYLLFACRMDAETNDKT